jgi:hypothetical protein
MGRPPTGEHVDLGQQHLRVDDTPEAITGVQSGYMTPMGQREGEALVADDDGVAGVVAALVADDEVGRSGERRR